MSPGSEAAVGAQPSPAASLWERPWLWLALALLSALPFLVAPLPMQPDWFSHVGRYHVMNAAGDPWLRIYYAFEWKLVGNLGVDLVVRLLGPLLGTERAAHLVVGLIPPLGVGGIYALARAAGRGVGPGAIAALPLLYALPFAMGFVNFCLAQALAFWAAAIWLRLARASRAARWAFAVPAGALVWTAHVAGWGILLILIVCLELASARHPPGLDARALARAGVRALPFALPLIPTLVWRAAGPAGGVAADPWSLAMKWLWLRDLFRGEAQAFDHATTFLVFALVLVLLLLLALRRAGAQAGLLGAGLGLFALFLLLPHILFGSYYADMRLLPAALILLLIAVVPRSPRWSAAIAGLGLILFAACIAVTSVGWHRRGTALERDLAVLDQVPRGSRIAIMAWRSLCRGWTPAGFEHAPSLAIVRRHAFVNSQWDYAGANLMRPIYNAGRGFNAVPSNLIGGPRRACEGRPLGEMLALLPRDRFDYVWMFEAAAPAGPDWLVPVARGPNGRLYRVEARPPTGKSSPPDGER